MKNAVIAVLCLGLGAPLCPATEPGALAGYSDAAARTEREWESKFRELPDPARMRQYMQRLTAHPHHLGSPYDHANAEWILSQFKSWGLDAHIESFRVLFPTPKQRVVELVEPTHFTAKLREPPVTGDSTSTQQDEALPPFNAYSIDGDVTAPLVYVNFGVPDDYAQLARLGISVKGAIVIARYGGSWRGIKPKVAAEHGAIGCLIYSDPHEDGYFQGDAYPTGAYRPSEGAQRGSVMDMPVYPGDPLTPGIAATADAKRLPISQAPTLTKIPVLPLSYSDAQPLLAALRGPVAPEPWRGSLPLTYHIGPGPAKVHLKAQFNWNLVPVYDVIARIPGSTSPDEWIIRGNHHDAWVNGADDPTSGAAALLEEARSFAALLRQGWKPARTILFCVWDGEEQGLLGSTEWVEAHAAELTSKAAVYINSDNSGRGYLAVSGSHTLEHFVNSIARDIEDPESGVTLWKRVQFYRIAHPAPSATPAERLEPRVRSDLRIEALGSGSDYSAFIDHLGVASLDIRFTGEGSATGVYHSAYDDFYWFTHFSDSDFRYGRALAETAGTAVMQLASAGLLPYDFSDFTDTIRHYVAEVEKLASDRRIAIVERNREIEEGLFTALEDPRQKTVAPLREPDPPFLNFAPLDNGLAALERATEVYSRALAHVTQNGGAALASASMREVNMHLLAVDRSLTLADGLPGRPWYRNQVYAPGLYTGYGVKTLPGVRESIEQKHWSEATEQIARAGKVLENAGEAIQSAAAALDRAE
ncbi:MAG TPA: transferrin receptor-like dimerization domain-containing protein [Bryobacteraceae bacterium]|nr:transferrin receptor-like dimerization domain-containing protein [Bryobacteraceae bacterium]